MAGKGPLFSRATDTVYMLIFSNSGIIDCAVNVTLALATKASKRENKILSWRSVIRHWRSARARGLSYPQLVSAWELL